MKNLQYPLLLLCFSLKVIAQDFEVPKDYKFEKAEDYKSYQEDVISCINWLEKTAVNDQESKRKEASKFLLVWLTGSPDVRIEIGENIVTFISSSPDLLMIFMGGWTKYSLETGKIDDKIGGNLAGIEDVIEFYLKNKEFLKKDKNIEKYIKMKDKGTLKEYIEKNA